MRDVIPLDITIVGITVGNIILIATSVGVLNLVSPIMIIAMNILAMLMAVLSALVYVYGTIPSIYRWILCLCHDFD